MAKLIEDTVEQATLDWLRELGYTVAHGPDIEPESANPARQSFDEAILLGRLRAALASSKKRSARQPAPQATTPWSTTTPFTCAGYLTYPPQCKGFSRQS